MQLETRFSSFEPSGRQGGGYLGHREVEVSRYRATLARCLGRTLEYVSWRNSSPRASKGRSGVAGIEI
ncbi:hypothetical protein [Rhodococcus qingshengii]|uniref:hypothetical protein n=1 Tax=Rhodococcus qingshengii TaxID=334542 RepID=UPI001FD5EAA1|nr:hypothetical protein [Rhodococcus qingshengii]